MIEYKGVKYNITQEPNPNGKGLIYQFSINLNEPLKRLNASTFQEAKKQKVAFVPGNPFYTDGRETDTLRLNYTNASQDMIREGITRLGMILKNKK